MVKQLFARLKNWRKPSAATLAKIAEAHKRRAVAGLDKISDEEILRHLKKR